MKIEHFALNVAKPREMASWYVEHLGMRIAMGQEHAPYTHFLADNSGDVMIEIYNNPADSVPDYFAMDPLICHLALVSADPRADCERLLQAGATYVSEVAPVEGTLLVMMRDPWGFALQLCKRAKPMLAMQIGKK
jgi:glyoxylase I family protein